MSFGLFDDTEKEVAAILLQLPTLIITKPAVPEWGIKGRRSPIHKISSTAPPRHRPPHQFDPIPTADHSVASQLEISCNGESDDEKPVTDDQRITFIEEKSSETKAEPSALEPSSTTLPCLPKDKVIKIKFKPPRPEKSPQLCYADESKQIINDEPPSPIGDVYPAVMVMDSNKKSSDKRAKEGFEEGKAELAVPEGRLVGGSRKIKAEPTTVLEANTFVPRKKPAKGKSKQEMENELVFWEQNKRAFLESIDKVKVYLESQKALNLQLKARKLQLSATKTKPDSG